MDPCLSCECSAYRATAIWQPILLPLYTAQVVLNTAVTNPAAIGVNLKIPSFRMEAILRVASRFVNVLLEELESAESTDNLFVMKQRKEK